LESRLWYTIPDLLGRDHDRFAGKTSLLVGCGLSAVTALSQFEQLVARVPQTKVVWAIRRPGQGLEVVLADPFPKRRKLVKGAMGMLKSPPPWLNFMGLRMMDSVSANGRFSVSLGGEEDSVNVSVDEVVTLVGYMPDNSIYGSWLNRPAEAPVVESGQEPSINPESGLFFLGARSYGVNSNFLMQTGHNQIRQAFKIIEGNPTLDLHQ
jgi:hypothetical protein